MGRGARRSCDARARGRTVWARRARLVTLPLLAASLSGCWWTQVNFSGDNARNQAFEVAISPATVHELEEAWRVDGLAGVTSTPATWDRVVYFGTWDGRALAVDATDGSLVWEEQLTPGVSLDGMVDDSPLVTATRVFLGDGRGYLHALDRATGATVWSRRLDTHANTRIFSSPVLVAGILVVGVASVELAFPKPDYTFRGSVLGLDADTGDELWRVRTSQDDATSGAGVSVWSSAAIDRGRGLAYIGTGQSYEEPAGDLSDSLLAIDYRTGEIEWSRQFTEDDVYTIFGTPPQGPDADLGAAPNLFHAGRDLVGIGDKAGVYAALDRDTGEVVWARDLTVGSALGGIMATSAYADGVVYVTSNIMATPYDYTNAANSSITFALDAATGATLWQRAMPASTFGALTIANGVLFQPTTPGALHALDIDTGATLWTDTPGGHLGGGVSVVGGRVYVGHGFWFFAAGANPVGGIVAYELPEVP